VVPKLFFADHLEMAEGLDGPINDFSAHCLTIVMRCTKYAEDYNKEIDTAPVHNLFHKFTFLCRLS
jgi:hypothetical protein